MSATDAEHRAAEWNVSPAMVERIERAAADRGVDCELVARGVTEQGLDPEQAAELRQLDTQRMADLAAANGRPPPDPETRAALGKLGGLLGDVVEFLDRLAADLRRGLAVERAWLRDRDGRVPELAELVVARPEPEPDPRVEGWSPPDPGRGRAA